MRRIISLRRFLNQDWLAILILVVLVTAIAAPIVASLRFFLQKVLIIGKFNFKKDLLPILIYLLNIAFGILYYVHCMTSPHYG